jgi:excisionase family DNA binding protein
MTPIKLSISEAAALFGVTSKTIRRAIAQADISFDVVAGRYKLHFESLLRWSQERPKIRNKLEKYGIGQYVGSWRQAEHAGDDVPERKGTAATDSP